MRRLAVVVVGLVVLALANYGIYSRERLLAEGREVLLPLAPVDPRSLIQGDYMALRFAAADDVRRLAEGAGAPDGNVVLAVDERGVGTVRRLDDGSPLAADEARMRYRIRGGRVRFATNAFFFQEGDAHLYTGARFGAFRVGEHGRAILTGLHGPDLERLGEG